MHTGWSLLLCIPSWKYVFFGGGGRPWVDWAACFWLILVHFGCSCSLSNSIRHHNSSVSAVMAQFRLFVVKAFVVMAFGCEDCNVACFDSMKNTAKTVCISIRLPWLSCIGEGWIEAGTWEWPGCKGSGNWNSLQPNYLSIVYIAWTYRGRWHQQWDWC